MRDPSRISGILVRLGVVWSQHPDLRLAQLIGNVYSVPRGEDPYHVEDNKFIGEIEDFYNERTK